MSRKGTPYENAHAERFFKTITSEEVYLWEYYTMEDVWERIPSFIENVYNKKSYIPLLVIDLLVSLKLW